MYQNGSYGYQQPHAPRKITEYPSWVGVSENDPRVRYKEIDYYANGNQTEIKEKVGDEYVSLRKNLWDEENRLVGVDLNPDEETGHPIAVYTYDAGGERVIKYNLDRIDVSSNATEVGQETKDNVMIYPSGLLMGKVIKTNNQSENRFIYTKHYYMGTERMSAKTGTFRDLGLYPDKMVLDKFPGINPTIIRNLSNQSVDDAETIVSYVYGQFDQTANIPQFNSFTEGILTDRSTHDPKLYDAFYFHPDHLGSSSYISNLAGNVSQHIEYMPFGEMLVDEHINSFNTPFKFNGKEYDEETGNYYYGARYYDPKWSIFISVDPLAEKTMSPYGYCYNNPVVYIDPTGMSPDWIDNGNGTYTAQKGDSAWSLYEQHLKKKGFSWDKTQQLFEERGYKTVGGKTVINPGSVLTVENKETPKLSSTVYYPKEIKGGVDTSKGATQHYFNGNGAPLQLGINTVKSLINSETFQEKHHKIISGKTTALKGNFAVDMTYDVFHVGRTKVDYQITVFENYTRVDYTLFSGDGYWDPNFIKEKFQGLNDKWKPDGKGPNLEREGGTPYDYKPVKVYSNFQYIPAYDKIKKN